MLLPTEETLNFNDNDIKDNTILNDEQKNELYRQIDLCYGFILQGGLYSSNYEIENGLKNLLKKIKISRVGERGCFEK